MQTVVCNFTGVLVLPHFLLLPQVPVLFGELTERTTSFLGTSCLSLVEYCPAHTISQDKAEDKAQMPQLGGQREGSFSQVKQDPEKIPPLLHPFVGM